MAAVKHWISAFRLRTLPLAVASIGMGSFLAAAEKTFNWLVFGLCVLTTILLQILSNLANDYGDTVKGADSQNRKGPSRAVQTGLISKREMRGAILIFILLCLISGIYLLYVSLGFNVYGFLFFLTIGILSIIAAVTYTIGRRPYGYVGLGDISVLLFFGLTGVLGSYFLQVQAFHAGLIWPALSCGLFSVAVLNINNIRDIHSDKEAGKYSLPVRLGRPVAVQYHWALLIGGILCAVIYSLMYFRGYYQFLFAITLPLFIMNGVGVTRAASESETDPWLKQMALSTLLFVLTFGLGLLWSV
ncbi:MAG: 1,4-dihydroxy-2-naphthoate polyprenyltransferase [Cyclobacteriaceae bacterium]|nr:1,4-dihydroxy-2-naphthoate polyprenyltransferase [Cyclobacteriaceae bacterium]